MLSEVHGPRGGPGEQGLFVAEVVDAVVRALTAGDGRRLNIGTGQLDCSSARRALGWEASAR